MKCPEFGEALAFLFIGTLKMRIITKKKLELFFGKHSDARSPLLSWHQIMVESQFYDPNDLRRSFPQVDIVDKLFVFNVGSAFRLIAAIHFNRQRVYVRHVLTHAEYDRGKWKKK
jgi:mRNA interferase HigB